MEKETNSTKKLPNYKVKPLTGDMGNTFSATNQPSVELKKAGWEQWRKERHLTQSIIKMMLGEDGSPTDTFTGYIKSLVTNARKGNPKAIDAVNKCLEDEIIKVSATNASGEYVPIVGMIIK